MHTQVRSDEGFGAGGVAVARTVGEGGDKINHEPFHFGGGEGRGHRVHQTLEVVLHEVHHHEDLRGGVGRVCTGGVQGEACKARRGWGGVNGEAWMGRLHGEVCMGRRELRHVMKACELRGAPCPSTPPPSREV